MRKTSSNSVHVYFKFKRRNLLPDDMALTPVGGALKIPCMVALLSAHELIVLVSFDENAGRASQGDIVINRIDVVADRYEGGRKAKKI